MELWALTSYQHIITFLLRDVAQLDRGGRHPIGRWFESTHSSTYFLYCRHKKTVCIRSTELKYARSQRYYHSLSVMNVATAINYWIDCVVQPCLWRLAFRINQMQHSEGRPANLFKNRTSLVFGALEVLSGKARP